MAEVALEVCVDSAAGLAAAVAGGADRIELCAALELGGLTPPVGLMRLAAGCGVPVHAMIRPRAGGFAFGPGDVAVMRADIEAARAAGLAGVVLGAALPDGRLDGAVLRVLADQAQGLPLTLHRVIDLVPDPAEALEQAVALGFARLLTSGGAASALAGRDALERMFRLARGRISVMPAAGIDASTIAGMRGLPLIEVHASCSEPGEAAPFGFGAPRRTSAEKVQALKAALVDFDTASG